MATRADVLRHTIDLDEKQATAAMRRYTSAVESGGRRVDSANRRSASSFSRLESRLTNFVRFAVGGAGVLAVVRVIDQLADRADTVTSLSTAFETLGGRINATSSFLPRLRVSTKGLINDLDLMKQANNAVILGVAKSEEQYAKLAEGAVRLGRAVGLGPKAAIESLTTGIGRQSRMMLDNLGIIVSAEESQARYAASIGKTVGELTDVERKTAFMEEASRKLDDALVGLTDQTDTLAQAYQRAEVTISNATAEMLKQANELPTFIGALSSGEVSLVTLRHAMELMVQNGLSPAQAAFTAYASTVDVANRKQERMIQLAKEIDDVFSENISPSGRIGGKKDSFDITQSNAAIAESRERLRELLSGMREIEKERRDNTDRVVKSFEAQSERYAEVMRSFSDQATDGFLSGIPVASDAPDFLLPETKTEVASFGDLLRSELGSGKELAADLGAELLGAALTGKKSFGDFMKALISDLIQAIAKAAILKAILGGSTGGAGALLARGGIVGAGGTSAAAVTAGGFSVHGIPGAGIPRAARGLEVRGGTPDRDSVPFFAKRGEHVQVLPRNMVERFMGAARETQRTAQLQGLPAVNASPAAAPTIVVLDSRDLDRLGVAGDPRDDPRALMDALRRASVLGV